MARQRCDATFRIVLTSLRCLLRETRPGRQLTRDQRKETMTWWSPSATTPTAGPRHWLLRLHRAPRQGVVTIPVYNFIDHYNQRTRPNLNIVKAEKHNMSPGRCPHYCLGPVLQVNKIRYKTAKKPKIDPEKLPTVKPINGGT